MTRDIIDLAKEVLKTEAEGILGLIEHLDDEFVKLTNHILKTGGRVVISGIGKSGLVGRKISATLSSTGTRSVFIHPVEAMHGDLGMLSSEDIFIAISNSGETGELNILIPFVKQFGCTVVAFTGKKSSMLAQLSDIVIDTGVQKEACSFGMVPTASTTAVMAMGDALSVALLEKREFSSTDFRKFHPGGSLGRRLSMNVEMLMLKNDYIPLVSETDSLKKAIAAMNSFEMGTAIITDEENRLKGIITDGDLRRIIADGRDLLTMSLVEAMTKNPKSVSPDVPAYDALNIMEKFQIMVLPVIDELTHIIGILHLHDILGKGEFSFNGS